MTASVRIGPVASSIEISTPIGAPAIGGCGALRTHHVPASSPQCYGNEDVALRLDTMHVVCKDREAPRRASSQQKRKRQQQQGDAAPVTRLSVLARALTHYATFCDRPTPARVELAEKRRQQLLADVEKAVRKDANREINKHFRRPCVEGRVEPYLALGRVVEVTSQREKRETVSYTICPQCGAFTVFSTAMFGPTGYAQQRLVQHSMCS